MSSKSLVRLHLPPPVIASFAIGLGPASNTVMATSGAIRLSSAAQKHPAAPAPMIATVFINYLIISILCILLQSKKIGVKVIINY